MKKKLAICLAAVALSASCAMVGCSGGPSGDTTPAGAPPLLPASHDGRYENLGPEGCYGCHGANENANPMLTSADRMPKDHYLGGETASLELNPGHAECQTCHAQG